MIRLFTTRYAERKPARRAELDECLRRNLACAAIDEICLLVEGQDVALPASPKLRCRTIRSRPSYADYFAWVNELAGADDLSIVANSDLWFDDHLKLFERWSMPADTVFALSRWNCPVDGGAELYDHNDSQDSWFVRGRVREMEAGFPVGVPRCDNRIAAEFERAGYRVLNPAFSLKSYHLHDGPPRVYDASAPDRLIPPPYKYIWPHNLFGPWRTWRIRRSVPLGYRIDRRRLARTLPWRVWRKLASLAGGVRKPAP
jgi:hypothetical protein